jgi:hypothetical protein
MQSSEVAERGGRVSTVLLAAALVGSVLLLTTIVDRHAPVVRRRARMRLQDRGTPEPRDAEEDDVPILHDVVPPEDLQRPPAEPPVLTDEVVPGRGGK